MTQGAAVSLWKNPFRSRQEAKRAVFACSHGWYKTTGGIPRSTRGRLWLTKGGMLSLPFRSSRKVSTKSGELQCRKLLLYKKSTQDAVAHFTVDPPGSPSTSRPGVQAQGSTAHDGALFVR